MSRPARRLVVLGDSLAFTDDTGPQLPSAEHVYPQRLRAALENATGGPWDVVVLARAGADVRETWRTVSKDRHAMFDVLPDADAVVVAIGSFDHAPAGTPAVLEAIVPFVASPRRRRRLRRTLRRAYPRLARLRRGNRMHPDAFAERFDQILRQVRGLTRGAAGVVLGPTSHRAAYYGDVRGRHPGRARGEAAQFAVARRHRFATVSAWPLVEPFADRLNADGIHWPSEGHAAVAGALAAALLDQIEGRRRRPDWYDEP